MERPQEIVILRPGPDAHDQCELHKQAQLVEEEIAATDEIGEAPYCSRQQEHEEILLSLVPRPAGEHYDD